MNEKQALLRHFLATLAYRTQKAVRNAPSSYAAFRAGHGVRTPHEIVAHMEAVLAYALTCFEGESHEVAPQSEFEGQVASFHGVLERLGHHLEEGTPLRQSTLETILQGPFSDAMTHAGQLAMLRRLAGSSVPPENFMAARVDPDNVGVGQPHPDQDALIERDDGT